MKTINLMPDNSGWVTKEENLQLEKILFKCGYKITKRNIGINQINFFPDKYSAKKKGRFFKLLGNKLAFDYYHGDPRISPEFKPFLDDLKKKSNIFSQVRVSHSGIEQLLNESGFSGRITRIPIGIDLDIFNQVKEGRDQIRETLGLPKSAFIIGSFQKDGVGWGNGEEPKLIKGPDIFLKVIKELSNKYDDIFVLLTGPSRSYLINGLRKLKVNFKHFLVPNYKEIAYYYAAIDVYLVTSREEGGPKAILESMASKVPLVSTRVGHALDLVENDFNGWISEIEDYNSLISHVINIYEGRYDIERVKLNGIHTAKENSYPMQIELWRNFFKKIDS